MCMTILFCFSFFAYVSMLYLIERVFKKHVTPTHYHCLAGLLSKEKTN